MIHVIGDIMLDSWSDGRYEKKSAEAPINIFERKKTSGIKKNTCLESVSINAGKALPTAWKYAEPIN